MNACHRFISVVVILAACGCASRNVVNSGGKPGATTRATTRPGGIAALKLDDIKPEAQLPEARKIEPVQQPPIEALELFARARGALLDRQRFSAIALLNRAAQLDPDSFIIHQTLGDVLQGNATWNQQSIDEFLKAAQINPNDIEVQTRLGRQYLAKGDLDDAIFRLRLARKTSDFAEDGEPAALTNFFLARALQQKGYLQAALDQYNELLGRVEGSRFELRRSPELSFFLSRPELLLVQIGELNLKNGNYTDARAALSQAAERMPDNFEVQSLYARSLLEMGDVEQAKKHAGMLVVRNRASADSLSLLRDVYKQAGQEKLAVDDLSRLVEQNPKDHSLLFALANMMCSQDRTNDAKLLLSRSLLNDPDLGALRRLVELHMQTGDTSAAAAAIVQTSALRPDLHDQTLPMIEDLVGTWQKNRLHLSTLQKLSLPAEYEAARLTYIAKIAEDNHRDLLAKNCLEQAVKLAPVHPPAFRLLLRRIWDDPNHSTAEKTRLAEALLETCSDKALREEIRGRNLNYVKQSATAITALQESIRLGNHSPDVLVALAVAYRDSGDQPRFEQMLWKIISDHPSFADAYQTLFERYLSERAGDQAIKVVRTWLSHDPDNVSARIDEAIITLQLGRADLAEQQLLKLFSKHYDDDNLAGLLNQLYVQQNRLDEWIGKLEDERQKHPTSQNIVVMLVSHYLHLGRKPEAVRVLESTREAMKSDADLLYGLSSVYFWPTLDEHETGEQVLQQVIDLEPRHASACNDLGYNWADRNRNLARAEQLIRVAVEVEPENESFLDSLGWVLYKRGKFADAEPFLRKAVDDAMFPDPVVIDHLGDTLYRQGRKELAIDLWNKAQKRLEEIPPRRRNSSDIQELVPALEKKLRQVRDGESVGIAKTADEVEGNSSQPKPETGKSE